MLVTEIGPPPADNLGADVEVIEQMSYFRGMTQEGILRQYRPQPGQFKPVHFFLSLLAKRGSTFLTETVTWLNVGSTSFAASGRLAWPAQNESAYIAYIPETHGITVEFSVPTVCASESFQSCSRKSRQVNSHMVLTIYSMRPCYSVISTLWALLCLNHPFSTVLNSEAYSHNLLCLRWEH